MKRRFGDKNDSAHVETGWREEIARRVHEIETGEVDLEDGAAAMRRLRDRARQHLRNG
jgi:hypothetical protein